MIIFLYYNNQMFGIYFNPMKIVAYAFWTLKWHDSDKLQEM